MPSHIAQKSGWYFRTDLPEFRPVPTHYYLGNQDKSLCGNPLPFYHSGDATKRPTKLCPTCQQKITELAPVSNGVMRRKQVRQHGRVIAVKAPATPKPKPPRAPNRSLRKKSAYAV